MSLLNKIVSSFKNQQDLSNGVVGIDIGSSSIKVVELQEKNEILTLTTYGELQLGPYANKPIGSAVHLDPEREQAALVDVIRESAVRAKTAVFAMPLSSSFVTNVSLEAKNEIDLSAMVRVEARKVIPASLSEVTLDWVELSKNNKFDEEKKSHDVLIAAIQNAALDRFNVLMQFAGLGQPPTEIECFSTLRCLYKTEEPNVAVLDIGASSSKLYLVQNGMLVRMYRVHAGGLIATENIAKSLNIDFEEAEAKKYKADRDNDEFSDIKRAHHNSYDRAFREFGQVLREFEKRSGLELDAIYLTGGGSLFPGVSEYAKETLGREVLLANSFSKVAYPAFMEDTLRNIGPSFSTALGAAIRIFE